MAVKGYQSSSSTGLVVMKPKWLKFFPMVKAFAA
jgi:hypothetical protein